jgi:hypothetical protein
MEILLSKFGSSFSSRPSAHKLFDKIQKNETIVVNFEGIKEASPSFCHEMLNIALNERKVKLKIINANDSIKFQLNKAIASLDVKEKKSGSKE